jgi:hypothetical protein
MISLDNITHRTGARCEDRSDVTRIFISSAFSNAVADLERVCNHSLAPCFPLSIPETGGGREGDANGGEFQTETLPERAGLRLTVEPFQYEELRVCADFKH